MKTIGITGGTGFVGHHLTGLLHAQGCKVIIFTRGTSKKQSTDNLQYAYWNPGVRECDLGALRQVDAMVHLAGAGLAEKRWNEERKRLIFDSRVATTNFLVQQLKDHAPNCKTLVCASATGFYGPDRDGLVPFTETAPSYADFLGKTCEKWEAASEPAAAFLRRVIIRFGIVLGKEAGAMSEFVKPMKFGVVPILSSGRQTVSWIHVEDLAALLLETLQHEHWSGIYNGVSPHPVSHIKLMHTIARIKGGIKIPVPVPAFFLKMILGEMSTEVLKSCTVDAHKTLEAGFQYKFPDIKSAVKDLLRK
ncbi:TIGR01777 family oxidoreductase [Chitinophagaceae bacterium MMS25-I14]